MLFFYTLSLALLAFASAQEEEPCSQAAMDIRDAANETLQVALNNSMDAAVALEMAAELEANLTMGMEALMVEVDAIQEQLDEAEEAVAEAQAEVDETGDEVRFLCIVYRLYP